MSRKSTMAPAARKAEQGFTLVEMVVSITLFLLVTGLIWGALHIARQSRTMVNQEVELSKTIRISLNLIGRDTYNAGYGYPLKTVVVLPDNRLTTLLGLPNDFNTSRDAVPPIIAGNDVTTNTLNPVSTKTDQVTFLYKDSSFNPIGATPAKAVSMPVSINAASTTSSIDEIVPISGSNTIARVNDLYLITGNTGSTLGVATGTRDSDKIQFANGDILGFNQTGTGGPLRGITVPASLHRINMVTYFVTADGVLTRRRYANLPVAAPQPKFIDDPLVYGVENFQIKYVMDSGLLLDNPSAGADGIPGTDDDIPAQLEAVRQVRFTINVRSWELDPQGLPYRASLTATYSTRNLGY